MLPRLTLPPPPAWLAGLALAFVVPGLAGHDPWKSHDAVGIGIVHNMALSGDWLVPHVALWTWLNDAPLYYWVALGFGKPFQLFVELHSAARLASGAFVLAACWLLYRAARDWTPPEDRRTTAAAALLLFIGSVGLIVHAHEALPQLATLAALSGALAVLPRAATRPLATGAMFGAALGLAFLSSTWIAPAALGLAVVAAHLACPEWRGRNALPFLAASLSVGGVLSVSWPLALYIRSPELFKEWWTLASQPQGALGTNVRYFLSTGSWFAWPAWPLAAWAAWSMRRRLGEPRLFVPAFASLATLFGAAYMGPPQDVNLLALLAPLALLASHGVLRLRRGAAAALDWFGVISFAFFVGLIWLGYMGMMTGVPPKVAANFARAAPGFTPEFNVFYFLFAAALTLAWFYIVLFAAPAPLRSVARWAAGVVLLWGTFAMLWMPWADYQKSYRSVALQLRSKIPVGAGCVAAKQLGVPQAAALDYHAGLRPRAFDMFRPQACALLLVQGSPKHEFDAPGAAWVKLADVGRPGDKGERYRLYRLVK
jgi:4-amino-4-deoxy-L-arabinose transferase-like glycosyltransferase